MGNSCSRRGRHADASGLPYALLENGDEELRIRVLARPADSPGRRHHLAPYDVQANLRPFALARDALGFREHEMGRAKVVHLEDSIRIKRAIGGPKYLSHLSLLRELQEERRRQGLD